MSTLSLLPPIRSAALLMLASASAGLGGGCAAPREPLRPPELISFVTYYGGDPVAGPRWAPQGLHLLAVVTSSVIETRQYLLFPDSNNQDEPQL